jgi:hypothetical protein
MGKRLLKCGSCETICTEVADLAGFVNISKGNKYKCHPPKNPTKVVTQKVLYIRVSRYWN